MANVPYNINPGAPPGASGSIFARIDNDNDSAGQTFTVEHDGGGAGNECFVVNEDGSLNLYGRINNAGTQGVNCTNASLDIIAFQSNSVVKAQINHNGTGIFTTGGVRLPVETSDPNGSKTGEQGDVVLGNYGGVWYLQVCTASPSTWIARSIP